MTLESDIMFRINLPTAAPVSLIRVNTEVWKLRIGDNIAIGLTIDKTHLKNQSIVAIKMFTVDPYDQD